MKKLIALLVALIALLSFAAIAEDEVYRSGDYSYTVNSDGKAVITKYRGSEQELVIPSVLDGYAVEGIGDEAFYDCSSLTGVTIPDSVISVGSAAFGYCRNLEAVKVSLDHPVLALIDGVLFEKPTKTLLWYPMAREDASYTIPQGILAIGDYAFYLCYSLTSVTIPDSVTAIGDRAFYSCDSLTSVTIPDSVISVGSGAFAACEELEAVKVSPDHPTLALIDGVLFEKPTKTLLWYPMAREDASYTIPQGILAIGDYAFHSCDSLTSVTIPDSVTAIGDRAFYSCDSLTSVTIPDSVTAIGYRAFRSCDSLTSVTIPDSVTAIGDEAFYGCSSLTSVTIPDSVTTIGDKAFRNCPSLTLTVGRNSCAKQYAVDNGVPYTYIDALDWLNS